MRAGLVSAALALSLVSSFATGCRSELFPSESRAAPELVTDLRGVGKVLAATTAEAHWDGHTEITDILVLDVGGSSFHDALDKVRGILRARAGRPRTHRISGVRAWSRTGGAAPGSRLSR